MLGPGQWLGLGPVASGRARAMARAIARVRPGQWLGLGPKQ